jgi:hypothetical protein
VGTFLLGGFGLWLALNGVVAARLIRRPNRLNETQSEAEAVVLRFAIPLE